MIRRRVLIDIEFTIAEDQFKITQLTDDATGVSDTTDAGIRDAVTQILVRADWNEQGPTPLRSIVTTRPLKSDGRDESVLVPIDAGIGTD